LIFMLGRRLEPGHVIGGFQARSAGACGAQWLTCGASPVPNPSRPESPEPWPILEYAISNQVGHVVGARASSSLRRCLGIASSRVVAEAPGSVTVVKVS
jgi:hypothetical protein